MKAGHLNIVPAGHGACVLDSGCQVAALSQSLEHATCGVVELAHLRAQAVLLTCILVVAPLTLIEVLVMKQGCSRVMLYGFQTGNVHQPGCTAR